MDDIIKKLQNTKFTVGDRHFKFTMSEHIEHYSIYKSFYGQ